MCLSIVFAANLAESETLAFIEKVKDLGKVYQYGIGIGPEKVHPGVSDKLPGTLAEPQVLFEVHDVPEQHCACDIDQDIRNGSRSGQKSKFFDFVRELTELENVTSLSVLFFQVELPDDNNIRKNFGSHGEFIQLLNRWNTWQVERFEPIRKAYEIGDSTPLLYTFTEKTFLN